jgi:hypothetical protein
MIRMEEMRSFLGTGNVRQKPIKCNERGNSNKEGDVPVCRDYMP